MPPETAPVQPKEDPEALVLRGRPRPAVRFRKGLVVGVTAAVAAALVTICWLALRPQSFRDAAAAVESGDPLSNGAGDALANVPTNYADVPRLGPPLPGDLGPAILEQQRSSGALAVSAADSDATATRRGGSGSEGELPGMQAQPTRSSPVMVQPDGGGGRALAPVGEEASPRVPAPEGRPQATAAPAEQGGKGAPAAFASSGVNSQMLVAAGSPWTLSAGTIIPASLITGLNSDLPGPVVAQVTENVRDSATGRTILIPQGARLIGSCDSLVAYGQRRALVIWTRIVLPDGSSIGLDRIPAADVSGFAGLEDKVDSHGWQLLNGIALSTLLGIGTQLSLGSSGSDLVRAIRESTQRSGAYAGDQLVSRKLDVRPTISVRPGWPVRAMVDKDLVLQPWRG